MTNKLKYTIIKCENGVGEWEIATDDGGFVESTGETFDTREEAERHIKDLQFDDKPVLDVGKWTQIKKDLLQLVYKNAIDSGYTENPNDPYTWSKFKTDDTLEEIDKVLSDHFVKDLPKNRPTQVYLDVKCDSFVSLETNLTTESAEQMTEESMYDFFVDFYKEKAIEKYKRRFEDADFVFEVDFHYVEDN
tara:strand:- start:3364 stop:3936 length:573 start_codon:yes stop_codon:yes gene_type:complete